MPFPLLAGAGTAGTIRGAFGVLSAHHTADRRRDALYSAYNRGRERLDLRQGDVRQNTAEGLIARGLAGGGLSAGRAVGPATDPHAAHGAVIPSGEDLSVTGARTLGQQSTTDLHREQGLEQNDLLQQRNNAIDEVGEQGTQQAVDAIGNGISTAMNVYGMGKELGAMRSSGSGAGGASAAATAAPSAGLGTIRGAYGIDVLNPVPVAAPTSGGGTTMGVGQPNYDFRRTG